MNSPEPHSVDDSREAPHTASLQSIGQAPLLPPREPLGVRIAGSLGRHHSLLVAVCVLLLWAIVAMPPLWKRDPYTPGSSPGHDVLVPQPAYLLDREETHRRQDEAANLVTTKRVGRTKQHYLNPVPIGEIADRWVSKYAQPFTRALVGIRRDLERGTSQEH